MAKRFKKILKEQFSAIQKREWKPLNISNQIPDYLKNIPQETLNSIYASGTFSKTNAAGDEPLPSGNIIGGIDVYRNAPDDPVELNKDWYAVIEDPNNDSMYLIKGPIKNNEHWIDQIPTRLSTVEILCVPSK